MKLKKIIKNRVAFNNRVKYGRSFQDVYIGESVIYVNSLYRMALAINQGNFAKAYNVGIGNNWFIEFSKVEK